MVLGLLLIPSAVWSGAAPSRPNILLILADDLGFSDLGCYGGEIATPNLDQLAASGLRFTQFYNTARCWPTRGALLTGYYPQQVRMDPPAGRFPAWTRTLPQYLRPLGYRCYHSGKWHVMGAPRAVADAGFDHSYRIEDHDRHFNPQRLIEDDEAQPPVAATATYYTATAIADHTIQSLQEHALQHADRPFFAYLAFTSPHFPLQAPAADIAKYRDRYLTGWETIRAERYRRLLELGIVTCDLSPPEPQIRAPSGEPNVERKLGPGEVAYALPWDRLTPEQQRFQATKMAIHAAMVDRLDQEVGRVLAQIRAMGALDNTLVLFLSDNGASAEILVRGDGHDPEAAPGSAGSFLCLGPGWSTVANTPFRRHKIWVHEGGVSTPLIVHWPAGLAARGELRHDVGHVVDLVPTLLEAAGATVGPSAPGAPDFPGRSLLPALAWDGAAPRDYVFFEHSGNRALRVGDWKIVSSSESSNRWSLYQLAADRAEGRDRANEEPGRVQAMVARWTELDREFRRQAKLPGVVITHRPASTGIYVGSPSLAVLPDGRYVASHDEFGPASTEHTRAVSHVFRSEDHGATWKEIAAIHGAFWSSLFVHRDALYLLGPDKHHGNVVIRRSRDGGVTWTSPDDPNTGLLRENGEYHCAPMQVIEHRGRLWRTMERRDPPEAWGANYRAGMMSLAVEADLLHATNWTWAEFLPSAREWNAGDMGGWLEGNAVVAPDGHLVNLLRVHTRSPDEKLAWVNVSADGKALSFDPLTGFVAFPGGAKKFVIRRDPRAGIYFGLASIVLDRHRRENPSGIRNALALVASTDLRRWGTRCVLLYHPDTARHGFQYPDWQFDGDDLIAVVRTAFDDEEGGAHNAHDANYLTFHRWPRFRELTQADSVTSP